MTVLYGLAGLFLGWLVVVLAQTWFYHRVGVATGNLLYHRRLLILLQNQEARAEMIVRAVAAGRGENLHLFPILVDGGSADATAFILKRLAQKFNLGFYQLGQQQQQQQWNSWEQLDLRHLS